MEPDHRAIINTLLNKAGLKTRLKDPVIGTIEEFNKIREELERMGCELDMPD